MYELKILAKFLSIRLTRGQHLWSLERVFIHSLCVLRPYRCLDIVLKNLNFGQFFGLIFSIRLIRGSTYTRVYTVIQACTIYSPRAKCGPHKLLPWPAKPTCVCFYLVFLINVHFGVVKHNILALEYGQHFQKKNPWRKDENTIAQFNHFLLNHFQEMGKTDDDATTLV